MPQKHSFTSQCVQSLGKTTDSVTGQIQTNDLKSMSHKKKKEEKAQTYFLDPNCSSLAVDIEALQSFP